MIHQLVGVGLLSNNESVDMFVYKALNGSVQRGSFFSLFYNMCCPCVSLIPCHNMATFLCHTCCVDLGLVLAL